LRDKVVFGKVHCATETFENFRVHGGICLYVVVMLIKTLMSCGLGVCFLFGGKQLQERVVVVAR
jgi:hypothetical protein